MNVALLLKKSQIELAGDKPSDRLHRLLEENDPTVSDVLASHQEHAETVAEVKAALQAAGVSVTRIRKRRQPFDDRDFDLVITVGGDGTLLAASHSVGTTPVLGVNSAPSTSIGFFCGARKGTAASSIHDALAGRLRATSLTRMEVRLNGEAVYARVLNDCLFCHQVPAQTSRYILEHGGRCEEQRSSGFWVGPAAGSTAAQRSAGGRVLPLSSKQLQLVVREAYRPFDEKQEMTRIVAASGASIVARSKTRNMRLYVDGPDRVVKVSLGDVIEFTQSPEPLRLLGIASRRRSWGRDPNGADRRDP
ncbi:MAG: NAD(+)/NADH kinase [Myxococcota bacterium]